MNQQERDVSLGTMDPLMFFGPNDARMRLLRNAFPNLKIIPRGNVMKVIGDATELLRLEEFMADASVYFDRYKQLRDDDIINLLRTDTDWKEQGESAKGDEVLVFGNSGLQIKARTPNQRKMVKLMAEHDMLFAIGPAGTGKTYTAVALAVRALKNKEVRRIILTRPAVEAGENLGFLPGDLKEKLDPYLQPLYDALRDMIPPEKLADHMEQGVIQIAPLAFMRGRTLDNAFVILDEAQNATEAQLKMFLTRMGQSARFIITGDPTQVDLPARQPSGLPKTLKLLEGIEEIAVIRLNETDVIRHRLVKRIIEAFERKKDKDNE